MIQYLTIQLSEFIRYVIVLRSSLMVQLSNQKPRIAFDGSIFKPQITKFRNSGLIFKKRRSDG